MIEVETLQELADGHEERFVRLKDLHDDLQADHRAYLALLDAGKISPEDYNTRVAVTTAHWVEQAAVIVGWDRLKSVLSEIEVVKHRRLT